MSLRLSATILAALFALAVLLAGCGGGQSNGESQDNTSGETRNQEASGGDRTSVETKMAIGRVAKAEDQRLIVRSNTGGQDPERMVFLITRNAKITLEGREATLEDIERGQQAQIRYFAKDDRNRAREVVLFNPEGASENSGTTS